MTVVEPLGVVLPVLDCVTDSFRVCTRQATIFKLGMSVTRVMAASLQLWRDQCDRRNDKEVTVSVTGVCKLSLRRALKKNALANLWLFKAGMKNECQPDLSSLELPCSDNKRC